MPIYEGLIKHQPPINLSIQTLHISETYEKIEKRQIDVGFVVRDRVHPNVIVTKCYNPPMVGLCTKRAELNKIKFIPHNSILIMSHFCLGDTISISDMIIGKFT